MPQEPDKMSHIEEKPKNPEDVREIRELRRAIENLAKAMDGSELEHAETHWIWESEFEKIYLPRILGVIKDDSDLWLGQWQEISRSFGNRMGIRCDKTRKILFATPPLLNLAAVKTYEETDVQIGNVVQDAMRKGSNMKQLGDRYLNSFLEHAESVITDGMEENKHKAEWDAIAFHYGYVRQSIIEEMRRDIANNPGRVSENGLDVIAASESDDFDDVFG